MENDLIDYFKCVGYDGPLKCKDTLLPALEIGMKDVTLRDLIVWLHREITAIKNTDETINQISQDEDVTNFVMEVCSLLKELNCPYIGLIDGPISNRLSSKENILKLLMFLVSELMAAKIVFVDKSGVGPTKNVKESSTAKDLGIILDTLQLSKPPPHITSKAVFQKLETSLKASLEKAPSELISKPLLIGRLSSSHWNTLKSVNDELKQEYQLRREMLLKRLDVTIQSFQWSDRVKGLDDKLAKEFVEKRRSIQTEPNVELADVIAARQDDAIIEKTSSQTARKNTQSFVHKVIIGRVPDRGGRPSEQEAPPPEMPSWQKERAQGGGGGGGGRGAGSGGGQFTRGGGGRVQGGWNQRDDRGQRNDGYDDRSQGRGDGRGSWNQHDDREQRGGRGRSDRNDGRGNWNQHDDRTERGNKSDYHDYRGGRGGGRGGRGGGRGRGGDYR